jgi:hypothetical protein
MLQASLVAAENTPIPVYLKVHAEPSPVGVGQPVYLSLFFTKPIPIVGSSGGGSLYTDLTIIMTHPDGKNQTFGPYTSDTTGGVGGIEFTPTIAGNYTVQAFYKGQTITNNILTYDILPTLSEAVTFTVQEDPIPGTPLIPLPQEYWSRPIYSTNFQWSQLGGNWWGLGKPSFTDTGGYDATGNNYNPYTQAPNTGHIMWVKPTAFGGQAGGPISGDQESQYTSTSILYRQFEPIILNGIIYYKLYPNVPTTTTSPGGTPGWDAVDLRTGELIWHKDTNDTLAYGWNMQFHTIQEYGTQAFLVAIGPQNSWKLYDPLTGYYIATITNVTSTTAPGLVETQKGNTQGAVYNHFINGTYPNLYLNMWNSTLCLSGNTASPSTIRPSGNINYSRGIQWSVPIPATITTSGVTTNITDPTSDVTLLTNPALSIAARTNEVIVLRSAGESIATFARQFGSGSTIEVGMSATNGSLLWGPINRTYTMHNEVSIIAAGDGYYVAHDKDTNTAYIYNIQTGRQVGSPIHLEGNALGTLSRGGAIAYGKCYIWDYGGYVNAIELENATIAWTLTPRSAGYDTPYGVYPIWHFGSHSIADGKLFLSEGRMYDPPLFTNARKLAINTTDGSIVWSVLGTYAREPSAIADGYMVGWNSYDAQIYTFGKGPSQTTVDVGTRVVPFGTSVLLSGSVLDQSAGTRDADRSARFPNGVAAVSDVSQSAWMEYVYMQQPKPSDVLGVTVELWVMDSNNNYRSIGTTTTDETGFYSYQWKPDIEGKFTVYAVFSGSESYWPSQAASAFAVDAAAPTQAPVPTSGPGVADTYFLPAVGAIIAVIAIIGALIMLMLRKRP